MLLLNMRQPTADRWSGAAVPFSVGNSNVVETLLSSVVAVVAVGGLPSVVVGVGFLAGFVVVIVVIMRLL